MPSLSQVHINQAMTQFAMKYAPPQFVADQVFPVLAVQKLSDSYYTIDPSRDDLKTTADARGLSAESNQVDWATGTGTYSISEHSLVHYIDDRVRANSDPAVNLEQNTTALVINKLRLNKEVAFKAIVDAAAAARSTAVTTAFSSDASDPVSVIKNEITTMLGATGIEPNVCWMDKVLFMTLCEHPDIIGRIQNVKIGSGTNAASSLAEILGVDKILVGNVHQNTSGTATPSLSSVWGDSLYLAHVAPNVTLETQSFGVTFVQGGNAWVVDQLRDELKKSDVIRVTWNYDQRATDSTLVRRLTGCLS